MKTLAALLIVIFCLPAWAAKVEGTLLERGTKRPLSDVNVFVLPAKLKATTDAKGHFVFEDVPEGEFHFVVNAAGYKRLDQKAGSAGAHRLYLERLSYQGLEATVVGKVEKRDETQKTMTQEQFLTMPGSGGDPVKAVQNLPGIAHVQGFSSQVVIQGSAPQDTSYLLDDHAVPLVFHFGGLTSVITPEAIESVDYFSAGYGPEYGHAMGGLIGLHVRDPDTERFKGFVFMDTMKAGALVEGPIDEKSSYLVTGRYSYLGYVLGAALKGNSAFDLTVAPSFGDFATVYKRKLSAEEDLRVVTLASHDELSFLFKEPVKTDPGLRGTFDNETTFYRLIPEWTHRYDTDHALRASFGLGQDLVRVDAGTDYFDMNELSLTQRAEWETKTAPGWKSFIGMDNQFSRSRVDLRLPQLVNPGGVTNPISSGSTVEAALTRDDVLLAPYWKNTIHAEGSRWTFMPSLRADYFSTTKEFKPVPRVGVRYDVDESLHYKAAGGVYYQLPQVNENAVAYGNPDLTAPYAIHYMLGLEKDYKNGSTQGWSVSSDLFYKIFQNLVVSTSDTVVRDGAVVPEIYNNDGRGRAYGAEAMIKYDGRPISGWLSYTLSRSYRNEPGADEHLFQYDQTHNLNLVVQYEQNNNWKFSSRARYVTGDPLTPVVGGTFDADNDVYVPIRGPFYSQRLDPFFQLDFRADKKWVFETWILWGYLDIQNITNRQNPESIHYSYDYSQSQTVNDLPILPTIGVRGEF